MSTETDTTTTETATAGGTEILNTTPRRLAAGAVGGFVGSLLMGAVMQMMTPQVLEMAVPALYGIEGPSLFAGWVLHLWHGVFLGLVYVLGVDNIGALRDRARSLGGAVGFGVGYGVLTTLLPVLVMPLWLSAVGAQGPPFPNVGFPDTLISAAIHILYAIPVALAYYVVTKDEE